MLSFVNTKIIIKCGRDGGSDRRSGSIIIVVSSLDARLPCKDGHQHVNIRLVRFPIQRTHIHTYGSIVRIGLHLS